MSEKIRMIKSRRCMEKCATSNIGKRILTFIDAPTNSITSSALLTYLLTQLHSIALDFAN